MSRVPHHRTGGLVHHDVVGDLAALDTASIRWYQAWASSCTRPRGVRQETGDLGIAVDGPQRRNIVHRQGRSHKRGVSSARCTKPNAVATLCGACAISAP